MYLSAKKGVFFSTAYGIWSKKSTVFWVHYLMHGVDNFHQQRVREVWSTRSNTKGLRKFPDAIFASATSLFPFQECQSVLGIVKWLTKRRHIFEKFSKFHKPDPKSNKRSSRLDFIDFFTRKWLNSSEKNIVSRPNFEMAVSRIKCWT